MSTLAPRVVVVHRRTELEELIAQHGTRGQVAFFLKARGRDLADLDERHESNRAALDAVAKAVPLDWRRGAVERTDLDRFLFEPDDLVLVVGQDGLVANVAKYLEGQQVIGVNPDPERNPGVLVRHAPEGLSASCCAEVDRSSCVRWSKPVRTTVKVSWRSTRYSSATRAARPLATACPLPASSPSGRLRRA